MFNCQGLNDKVKQTHITDYFYKFSLSAIIVQETCIKETGLHEFTSSGGKHFFKYNLDNGAKSILRSWDNHSREHKQKAKNAT